MHGQTVIVNERILKDFELDEEELWDYPEEAERNAEGEEKEWNVTADEHNYTTMKQ